ncbi:MAG: hypothetical protein Q9220_000201 [cf. Caloplaca sp. 1 TL-2023]
MNRQAPSADSVLPEQFTQYYYTTFDENRSNLRALYRDNSMLTFESSAVQGVNGIVEKLTVDEEERPMNYTQVFQLLPDGAGSYFVFNDMFKLIYG